MQAQPHVAMRTAASFIKPSGTSNEVAVKFLHRAHAALLHRRPCLAAYEFENLLDTFLTECPKAPQVGASDPYSLRSHRERLDHVSAPPESAVRDDRHASVHCGDDFRQGIDCRATAVLAAATVIGNEDAIHSILDSKLGIFGRENALENDLHLRDVAHPFDRFPGQVARLCAAGDPGQIDSIIIVPPDVTFREAAPIVASGG